MKCVFGFVDVGYCGYFVFGDYFVISGGIGDVNCIGWVYLKG